MENSTLSADQPSAKNEEWFLSKLEESVPPFDELFDYVSSLQVGGRSEEFNSSAEMLEDALAEKGSLDKALIVLRRQIEWAHEGPIRPETLKGIFSRLLEKAKAHRGLVDHLGFDKGADPLEALRRLVLLITLQPGRLCYNKTWGFGVVRNVDHFYGKVVIDFDKKQNHALSLAYAAESLELLDEAHLLAVKYRSPDTVRGWIEHDQAELVRAVLRSFGPMNVNQLQQAVVPDFVAESGWKSFWEAARKVLKNDPLFDLPARRTESMRLRQKAQDYGQEWFEMLARERDIKTIFEKIAELEGQLDVAALDEPRRKILTDRISFVVKGVGRRYPGMLAKAVMMAKRTGVAIEGTDVAPLMESFLSEEFFLDCAEDLSARDLRLFLKFLFDFDAKRFLDLLQILLLKMPLDILSESIALLVENGRTTECADIFRDALFNQKAGVAMVSWVARNFDRFAEWRLGDHAPFVAQILNDLDENYSGDRLKAKNQLKERFENLDWLKRIIEPLNESQRRDFILRLRDCLAWPSVDRKSVLARVVKMFPDMLDHLAGKTTPGAGRGAMTSLRSYYERQTQLEKIVNVEIPKIAREIGVARSYGDLSENHEFKAAKEMQGLLVRRRAELEKMLHEVRPSDFKDLPFDKAGLATSVAVQYPDGKVDRYFILGEWDRDEKLGIISCNSQLAKAVEGHKAGDLIQLPTEQGDVTGTLTEVGGLTPEVRNWIESKA